jgi:hypothetical protein
MSEWLRIALSPPVLRRGCKYAIVVGAILIAINHGDAILRRDVDATRLWKMALTVLVPFLVSTSSSVQAIRQFEEKRKEQ